jgi:hypothetical protein
MRSLPHVAATLTAALSASVCAQTPDVLLPSGNLDGIYRLVDRNNNGNYLDDGDAYDYVLNGVDSSIRNVVYVPGAPGRLYCTSTILEQVLSFWDTNANGVIDSSEITIALDFGVRFGSPGSANWEVQGLDHAGGGVLYVVNDAGTREGIFRCQDLNADGDFMDNVGGIDETTAAAVEPTTLTVTNAPNSGNPVLALTDIQSIAYDPSWGPYGRFLVEEELFDFTLALQDNNGDGDFTDANEAYLFSALWNGGTIGPDVNPDVTSAVLPISNEMLHHAVDTSTTPSTYYLLSFDSTATQPDAAILFRGRDLNQDGDVNDAGELNIYWDGSLDSTGAVNAYNFCYGLHAQNGTVWVTCEWDGATDHEHLVRLQDGNADGDANDVGELTLAWDLPLDLTHYDPLVLPAGTLPAPPPGLPGTYEYYGAATCPTSLASGLHNVQIGSNNWNDKPVIGDATFVIRTWGAAPTSAGIYNLGIVQLLPGFPLNPAGTCNLYTLPLASRGLMTDAAGQSNDPLPIPNDPGLIGAVVYWQSIVIDPIGPYGVTVSDGAKMRIGAYSYSVN